MVGTPGKTIASERQLPDQHSFFGDLGAVDVTETANLNQLSPAGGVEAASGNIHILCFDDEKSESATLSPLSAARDKRFAHSLTTFICQDPDVKEERRVSSALDPNHALRRGSNSRAPNQLPGIRRKEHPPSLQIEILCPTRRYVTGIELILLVGGFNGPFPQGDPAKPAVHQLTLKDPIDQEVPGDLRVRIPALRSEVI